MKLLLFWEDKIKVGLELVTIIWRVILGVCTILLVVVISSVIYSKKNKKKNAKSNISHSYASEYRRIMRTQQYLEKRNRAMVNNKRGGLTNVSTRNSKTNIASHYRSRNEAYEMNHNPIRFIIINNLNKLPD